MEQHSFRPRSDLAVEDENVLPNQDNNGIVVSEREVDDITIVHVDIDEDGASRTGREPGKYLTLETLGIREKDTKMQASLIRVLSEEFQSFMEACGLNEKSSCLVIGLGNREVTPDALGPKTVDQLLVTRHLFELGQIQNEDEYRNVSAMSPGVMGVTGIETSEVLFGIVEKTKPDFVVAVDALAARSIERVNATIQISDTGIHPGSGVKNARKQLNEKTLGVPVIGIGIPTVVDAVSITSDTIDFLFKHFGREVKDREKPASVLTPSGMTFGERKQLSEEDLPDESEREKYFGIVGTLEDEDKRKLIQEVLNPLGHNLMVTPKEVDTFMEDMANVVAESLNVAFHKTVTVESSGHYTH